jgi:glycerate dehydrogenase
MTLNITFLDAGTFPAHFDFEKPNIKYFWQQFNHTPENKIIERCQDSDIVISNKVVLNAETLTQLPNLKMIAVAATGFNNIDIEYCQQNNIAVNNVSNYSTDSVCEHILTMIFTLKRQLTRYNLDVHKDNWTDSEYFCRQLGPISDVNGSVLGIVGFGNLGKKLKHAAETLGMTVLISERKGKNSIRQGYTAFDEVLASADIISLNCPLDNENHHLFSQSEFNAMKKSAIFINTARGPLVNEADLLCAIESNDIAACGLDVVSVEPITKNNPIRQLFGKDNVIITPHVAWSSEKSLTNLMRGINKNIERFNENDCEGFLVPIQPFE